MPRYSPRIRLFAAAGVLLLGPALASCTWVKVTPEGSKVRIAPADRVADCRHLGELTVYTKASLVGVDRNAGKIQEELETLARNEAATMNGDTIVADAPVKDGRQRYLVYRCL